MMLTLREVPGEVGLSRANALRSIALLEAHGAQGAGPRSVAEVARQCGLSRGHFAAAFKASTGRTPYQWLLVRKIDKAKMLLKRGLPLAGIALDCGFADQAHLTRVFSTTVGVTPGRWKALYAHR
ncbi:MAG: AraC family transcriptional regulator [Rubrivivax sp.]|nr:MAG: AraC family transcriptional regulator [Rubrivivax sp.]